MFLDQVALLGLLKHEENTNILGGFSLAVRRIVVGEVVKYLADPTTPKTVLTTPDHVKWVLEVTGQSFSLPVEEDQTITNAIGLYRRWMLEPDKRPKPLAEDFSQTQFFVKTILKHFSLLFAAQYNDKTSSEKHAKLCIQVLETYRMIAREIGKTLTTETWEIWLKVILGIVDAIFIPGEETLRKSLSPHLLQMFFEVWLSSQTTNPAMWEKLKELLNKNWLKYHVTSSFWTFLIVELTKSSVVYLFGPTEGTASISIKGADLPSTISLNYQTVFYSWIKLFYIINNVNELSDPQVYSEVMKGVNGCVGVMLDAGNKTIAFHNNNHAAPLAKMVVQPHANTILHLVGLWLFGSLKSNRAGFEEGTALAADALGRIFHFKRLNKFEPIYLATFYSCLIESFQKDDLVQIAFLLQLKNFIADDLEGSKVILPHLLFSLSTQLSKNQSGLSMEKLGSFERVRAVSVQLLASCIGLVSFFDSAKFAVKLSKEAQTKHEELLTLAAAPNFSQYENVPKPLPEISTYSSLRPHLSRMILLGLRNENNADNYELLLACAVAQVLESPSDLGDVVTFIVDVGFGIQRGGIQMSCVRCLASLGQLVQSRNFNPTPKVIGKVLNGISSLMKRALEIGSDDLVIESFFSLSDWIHPNYQLLLSNEVSSAISSLTDVIGLVLNSNKPASRDAARYFLSQYLNFNGKFPSVSGVGFGASKMSTTMSEDELKSLIEDPNQNNFVRHFLLSDSTIITTVDIPSSQKNGLNSAQVGVLIRDAFGKYCFHSYNLSSQQSPSSQALPPPKQSGVAVCNTPISLNEVPTKDDSILSQFSDLTSFLEKSKAKENIIEISNSQTNKENDALKGTKFRYEVDVRLEVPVGSEGYNQNDSNKFIFGRMLLNHLGFMATGGESLVQQLSMQQIQFIQQMQSPIPIQSSIVGSSQIGNTNVGNSNVGNTNLNNNNIAGSSTSSPALVTSPPLTSSQTIPNQQSQQQSQQPQQPQSQPQQQPQSQSQQQQTPLFLLPLNPDSNLPLLIKQLDDQSNRQCMNVGVMYFGAGQGEEGIGNGLGSLEFEEMISGLGWTVDSTKHNSYAPFKPQEIPKFIYWSNHSWEVAFLVTSMMSSDVTLRRSILSKCPIVVVWIDDPLGNPKLEGTLANTYEKTIVISPFANGLLSVRILSSKDLLNVGPLIDGITVRRENLATLVRMSCMNAQRSIWISQKEPGPHRIRQRMIQDISKHRKETSNELFFSYSFGGPQQFPKESIQTPNLLKTSTDMRKSAISTRPPVQSTAPQSPQSNQSAVNLTKTQSRESIRP